MPGPTDPRVILALERTLLAWTRTALALVAFGFVAARLAIFLREVTPSAATPAGSRWVGLALVLLGGLVQASALVAHAHRVRQLRAGVDLPLRVISPATALAAALILLAVLLGVYLATL